MYNPNECTSAFCIALNLNSKNGRIWMASAAQRHLMIQLNNVPVFMARIDTFKPKSKQVWELNRFRGDWKHPIKTYKLDELDKFAADLLEGKLDAEIAVA